MHYSKRKPRQCPQCGAKKVVPIVYGMPAESTIEEAEKGKLALGGCIVTDDDPSWKCTVCDAHIYHERLRATGE